MKSRDRPRTPAEVSLLRADAVRILRRGLRLSSHDLLTCFNARSRGTCTNRRSIKRQEVEARVLRAMRERFFEPGAFAAFCEGFTAEMNAAAPRTSGPDGRARGGRFAAVEREIRKLVQAIKDGVSELAIRNELLTLEARKADLDDGLGRAAAAGAAPADGRRLPSEGDDARRGLGARRAARRRPTGAARISRQDRDSTGRWAVAGRRKRGVDAGRRAGPRSSRVRRRSVMLVAGAGFEPATFGL